MARHNELGKEGERLAADWLMSSGYFILEKNWRIGKVEIDIIAKKGEWLHFIEVKTRTDNRWGRPEDSVNHQKFANWRRAVHGYLMSTRHYRWIQYDIIAVTLTDSAIPVIEIFEDVYC